MIDICIYYFSLIKIAATRDDEKAFFFFFFFFIAKSHLILFMGGFAVIAYCTVSFYARIFSLASF